MKRRVAAVVFRLVFALGALSAIAFQLFAVHIPNGYSVFNFFTYFTNLSNLLISIVFIVSAVRLMGARSAPTPADSAIRGAAVVYIAFVGLVFNTLLRDAELGDLDPVVNAILHFALPIAGIVDWIVWPPRNTISLRAVAWWMVFPAAYTAFSLIRGAATGFYPYPFFDPGAVGGYGAVALYCLGMLVGFLALSFGVRALGNARARSRREHVTEVA